MHLSYRGVSGFAESFTESFTGLKALRSWSDAIVSASKAVSLAALRVVPGRSIEHELTNIAQHPAQDQLYSVERKLQLAYAVGDRQAIRALEADLETLTGWRYQYSRAWLKQ